jgi:YidC/Oxa1 family membrane protein insertase
MDRNSIIGFILIALIIFGFFFYQSKQLKEKAINDKNLQDSIALIQKDSVLLQNPTTAINDTIAIAKGGPVTYDPDSIKEKKLQDEFGVFAPSTKGTEEFITLENEVLKLIISNKGGRIYSAELKDYKTYDSLPLVLFKGEQSVFRLNFFAQNRNIYTDQLFFTPASSSISVSGNDSATVSMRLSLAPDKYLEYQYTIHGNSYMIDTKINTLGMHDVINANTNYFLLDWGFNAPRTELNIKGERDASTVYYKYATGDVDFLSPTSNENEKLATPLKWISFKRLFFSSILIAGDNEFEDAQVKTEMDLTSTEYTKQLSANITIPYDPRLAQSSYPMKMYLGPNHYQTLKQYDIGLEDQISLGWSFISYINKWIVIPLFNFLNNYIANYGIIILILTIVLKTLLFPLTYKAYLSGAKMRIIKPELDVIDKKYADKKEEMLKSYQEKQQIMNHAGVSPFGGCLPMLLQLPILMALLNFFPSSIELRQESFLWAADLSSYDSIFSWQQEIPILSAVYGNHISLFAILMTISTFITMMMNSQQMAGNPQAQQMKWMMYLMPILFLGFLNSSSAALSYYYLLANLITIAQTFIMQKFVDDKALLAKIEAYRKKPASQKKSSFQKRLEEMAKQRGMKLPK